MRRVISLIAATALTMAGAVLFYFEFTSTRHVPGRLVAGAVLMLSVGLAWLWSDIKEWLLRDRQEMLNMRATMVGIHKLLFPENEMTGAVARMKTGLALEQHLENRLGVMGPDFFSPVTTDYELEREAELLDRLPPERLDQLSSELGRLAERTLLERGDPETWEGGEDTKNVAHLIALRLLSAWLKCKSIVHTSMNRKVIKEAQDLEDLHYSHIQRLLRIFRGEKAIQETDN